MKPILLIITAALVCAGCSGNNDSGHTTTTTVVPPPPRQVLVPEEVSQTAPIPVNVRELAGKFDPTKPLLYLLMPATETVHKGQPVVISFSLANVKLRGDGGEYRVRYIVDDDDMQWIDRWEHVVLAGWLPGKHTIRVELVGPDGWPYRNGDYNVETREIIVK
jgi:hypothetical protein